MRKLSWALYAFALIVTAQPVAAQYTPAVGQAVSLWPNGAPGSEGKTAPERWIAGSSPDAFHRVTDIHKPSIIVYLPLVDNDGRRFPDEVWQQALTDAVANFGGATLGGEQEGWWWFLDSWLDGVDAPVAIATAPRLRAAVLASGIAAATALHRATAVTV